MSHPERVERLCVCAAAPRVGQAAYDNWMRTCEPRLVNMLENAITYYSYIPYIYLTYNILHAIFCSSRF